MSVYLVPYRTAHDSGFKVVGSNGVVYATFRGVGSKRRALSMIERMGKISHGPLAGATKW